MKRGSEGPQEPSLRASVLAPSLRLGRAVGVPGLGRASPGAGRRLRAGAGSSRSRRPRPSPAPAHEAAPVGRAHARAHGCARAQASLRPQLRATGLRVWASHSLCKRGLRGSAERPAERGGPAAAGTCPHSPSGRGSAERGQARGHRSKKPSSGPMGPAELPPRALLSARSRPH